MTSAPKSSLPHSLTSLKYVGGGAAEQFLDAASIILLGRIEERNVVYAEKKEEERRCQKVFCMNTWEVFFPKEHYLINVAVAETTAHSINSNTLD